MTDGYPERSGESLLLSGRLNANIFCLPLIKELKLLFLHDLSYCNNGTYFNHTSLLMAVKSLN